MLPKRVYWIGSEKYPDGYVHERPVHALLRERGVDVVIGVWDRDPIPELGTGEYLVVRTPWDYVEKHSRFLEWLNRLPARGVYNPAVVLRWNSDKNYLRELEAAGVPIVPTVWLDAGSESEVTHAVRTAFPGKRKIVKPTRSHSSIDTFRLGPDELAPRGVFVDRPTMIQPYVAAIETDGERSLVFFGGRFSHAVRKRPKSGDFRVQESHGGLFSEISVSPEELRFGADVLAAVRKRFPEEPALLYARVDYVLEEGKPRLMEAELLEPDLYFHHSPGAAERFVAAFLALPEGNLRTSR